MKCLNCYHSLSGGTVIYSPQRYAKNWYQQSVVCPTCNKTNVVEFLSPTVVTIEED